MADLSDLDDKSPLPLGWHKFLNFKTGEINYGKEAFSAVGAADTMSRNGRIPGLDLKLNLSPPANRQRVESPNRSASPMSPTSTPTSCVSSEVNMMVDGDAGQALQASNSPDAMSMVLVGCPRCLMYVMLSDEQEPKCPKCKSSVLLDFQSHHNSTTTTNTTTKKKRKSQAMIA